MLHLKEELYALIQKNPEIFDFIQESALDGLWYLDLSDPSKNWVNSSFLKTIGYPISEEKSLSFNDLKVDDTDESLIQTLIDDIKNHHTHRDFLTSISHSNGSNVWLQTKVHYIKNEAGEPFRLLIAHNNITSVKNNAEEIKKQSLRFNNIIDGTGIGTWEWNIGTNKLVLNERWANIIGYTLAELEPIDFSTWEKYTHPNDLKEAYRRLDAYIKNEIETYECEVRMKHKDGHWVWIIAIGKIITWTEDGKPEWMMGSHKDISERKQKEELISKYVDLLERTAKTANIGSWEVDIEKMTTYWSPVTKAIHEVAEDYTGDVTSAIDFYPVGYSRDKMLSVFTRCYQNLEPYDVDLQIVTAKGNLKWVRAIGVPVVENGSCKKVYGLFQDINERTLNNKRIALQEELFRKTFEYAAIGIALVGLDGSWLKVNNALIEMLGYSVDELLSLSFDDLTHPADRQKDQALLPKLFAGEIENYHLEKRLIHKSGTIVYSIVATSLVKNELGEPVHFVAQITNISLRKEYEKEQKIARLKLQSILDSCTEVSIIETDLNGIIITFNTGAEKMLGYTPDEVLHAKTPNIIHDLMEVEAASKELSATYNQLIEGFETFVYKAKLGNHDTREWSYVRKDGSRLKVLLTVTAIKDISGEVCGFLGIATDITQLDNTKQALKELLQVTKDQNSQLLNFTHIVSHNLRSHAANLHMLLEMQKEELPETTTNDIFPLLDESVTNLRETIDHLNDVVSLKYNSKDSYTNVNIAATVNKAISNVRAQANEAKATFQLDMEENLVFNCIPAYIESIVLNFITNAIKYRAVDRPPHIKITAFENNQTLVIKIADNGLGIDLQKNGDKLFGLYKTFHNNKDSKGLGLFITKNQIEAMNGTVAVESAVNIGSTFTISFKTSSVSNEVKEA